MDGRSLWSRESELRRSDAIELSTMEPRSNGFQGTNRISLVAGPLERGSTVIDIFLSLNSPSQHFFQVNTFDLSYEVSNINSNTVGRYLSTKKVSYQQQHCGLLLVNKKVCYQQQHCGS